MTWIKTMHTCATLYSAISNMNNQQRPSDELAHPSKARRDFDNISKFVNWFEDNDPFNVTDSRLHSLTSGVASNDNDCECAEEICARVMYKINGQSYAPAILRQADKV